jgi:hypothetical protein
MHSKSRADSVAYDPILSTIAAAAHGRMDEACLMCGCKTG